MFDREGFKAYVGINSGNSYASGLESIEKEYGVDIDFEIGKDHGAQLLARINVDKKQTTASLRRICTRCMLTRKSMVRRMLRFFIHKQKK